MKLIGSIAGVLLMAADAEGNEYPYGSKRTLCLEDKAKIDFYESEEFEPGEVVMRVLTRAAWLITTPGRIQIEDNILTLKTENSLYTVRIEKILEVGES